MELHARVKAYTKLVSETEHKDTVAEFTRLLAECSDPNAANLAKMLKQARRKGPDAEVEEILEGDEHQHLVLRRCVS